MRAVFENVRSVQRRGVQATSRWAAGGAILGVVLGVLAFAPAAWLAGVLAAASGAQIKLAEPRGSLWHGSAGFVLSGGEGSQDAMALPGRLEWELALGVRGLHVQLKAACCTPTPLEFDIHPSWGGFELLVADRTSQWPAALLAGLGAPWNTVQAQGQMHFSSERLSVKWTDGRISLEGSARLDALDMSSRLSTLRPLGSYRLSLAGSAEKAPPVLQLQTLDGSLKLSGNGQWTGSHWRFLGEASAAPQSEAALGNLLNMVGRRQGAKSVISFG